MEIQKGLANNIVIEMKKIIEKDLNFIDINGKIIASTDEKRIGTYHEGAKKSIKENKVIIIDWDEQFPGAKEGINIPLQFLNETIGAIGISGTKEEVEKYGFIIKKMSEILIKEAYLFNKKDEEDEVEKNLLENILFEKNISEEITKILNIKNKSRVIILKIMKEYEIENLKKFFHKIKDTIKDKNKIFMLKQDKVIILFIDYSKSQIEESLKKIKNINFKIGFGEEKNNIYQLKDSYKEALIAIEWCEKNNKNKMYYEDMLLEILLNNLDIDIKNRYLTKVFKSLSFEELKEYKNILTLYEKYNGSLKKISQELFLHSNTLQYKLNKFYDKTGFDIRSYEDFVILKIAFSLI